MKIVMLKRGRQWHWRYVARNGKTICASENYSGRAKCRETAAMMAALLGVTLEETPVK